MQILPYNPLSIATYGLGYSRFARRYSGNRKNLLPDYNGAAEAAIIRKKVLYIAFFSSRY